MDNIIVRQRRIPPDGLGPMLLEARQRFGLSQSALGRLVDVDPAYIAKLEHGIRCPSVTVALRLAEALGLDERQREQLRDSAVGDAGRDHPQRRP